MQLSKTKVGEKGCNGKFSANSIHDSLGTTFRLYVKSLFDTKVCKLLLNWTKAHLSLKYLVNVAKPNM